LKQTPAFDATIVAADYAPPIDQLVLALKFGGRLELAPLFADLIHGALCRAGLPDTSVLMIAVPLGQRRLAERGFNQALEIAKPLARTLGTQLHAHAVVRQRDTVAQSLLHPDERHKNLRDAFAVSGSAAERIRDRHITVVDDVMTTGETLNALAATLKRAGAASVTNLVLARTPQK
jgi:ComF family protein